MPDPKLQKLADYLRAGYVPPGQRPPPAVVPPPLPPVTTPMDPAAYRMDRFMRRVAQAQAQAQVTPPPTPALQRQLMLAQALRRGAPAARASGEEIPQ